MFFDSWHFVPCKIGVPWSNFDRNSVVPKMGWKFNHQLGGGFKYVLFSPQKTQKKTWSNNLTYAHIFSQMGGEDKPTNWSTRLRHPPFQQLEAFKRFLKRPWFQRLGTEMIFFGGENWGRSPIVSIKFLLMFTSMKSWFLLKYKWILWAWTWICLRCLRSRFISLVGKI